MRLSVITRSIWLTPWQAKSVAARCRTCAQVGPCSSERRSVARRALRVDHRRSPVPPATGFPERSAVHCGTPSRRTGAASRYGEDPFAHLAGFDAAKGVVGLVEGEGIGED